MPQRPFAKQATHTLPQLNIGEESLPHRLFVVLVQHDNLLSVQGATTSNAVRSPRIPPGCSEDELVPKGETEDEEKTDGVFEEVVCRERRALGLSISFDSAAMRKFCS